MMASVWIHNSSKKKKELIIVPTVFISKSLPPSACSTSIPKCC